MPKYSVHRDRHTGTKVKGTLDASSAVRGAQRSARARPVVVEVKERKNFTQIEITTKKLKPADLMVFSRQFAAFLRAGIPILDALDMLMEDASNKVNFIRSW